MLLDLGHRSIHVYPLIICRSSRRYHQHRYPSTSGRGTILIDAPQTNINSFPSENILGDRLVLYTRVGWFCSKIEVWDDDRKDSRENVWNKNGYDIHFV